MQTSHLPAKCNQINLPWLASQLAAAICFGWSSWALDEQNEIWHHQPAFDSLLLSLYKPPVIWTEAKLFASTPNVWQKPRQFCGDLWEEIESVCRATSISGCGRFWKHRPLSRKSNQRHRSFFQHLFIFDPSPKRSWNHSGVVNHTAREPWGTHFLKEPSNLFQTNADNSAPVGLPPTFTWTASWAKYYGYGYGLIHAYKVEHPYIPFVSVLTHYPSTEGPAAWGYVGPSWAQWRGVTFQEQLQNHQEQTGHSQRTNMIPEESEMSVWHPCGAVDMCYWFYCWNHQWCFYCNPGETQLFWLDQQLSVLFHGLGSHSSVPLMALECREILSKVSQFTQLAAMNSNFLAHCCASVTIRRQDREELGAPPVPVNQLGDCQNWFSRKMSHQPIGYEVGETRWFSAHGQNMIRGSRLYAQINSSPPSNRRMQHWIQWEFNFVIELRFADNNSKADHGFADNYVMKPMA